MKNDNNCGFVFTSNGRKRIYTDGVIADFDIKRFVGRYNDVPPQCILDNIAKISQQLGDDDNRGWDRIVALADYALMIASGNASDDGRTNLHRLAVSDGQVEVVPADSKCRFAWSLIDVDE